MLSFFVRYCYYNGIFTDFLAIYLPVMTQSCSFPADIFAGMIKTGQMALQNRR